ncbi:MULTISPECIES: hypothetical protein [unclassified Mesorhizobium]|uniref:hypothetical protein n=1 Tax=unclassified Mesorhizobium TaxID=325217 RepID=UPI003338F022
MGTPYPVPKKTKGKSGVANGSALLPGVDGRTAWSKRLYDVIAQHVADLGGPDAIAQSQYIIIKSAAHIALALEQMEVQFANEGTVNTDDLMKYQTSANSLRRLLESLGLKRAAKPPKTIEDHLASKRQGAA